jgi:hypothetical protein
MVLRLIQRSPRRRIRLATVASELNGSHRPVGLRKLRQLDTSNGCQDHTALPYASAPVVCTLCSLTDQSPPCEHDHAPNAAASTATCPNVRDDGQRPSLRDRMAGVLLLIWGRGEADYFCARDWTGQITLNRLRKIYSTRIDRTVIGLSMRRGITCEMAHRQVSFNLIVLIGWSPPVGLHHAISRAVAS